MSRSRLDRQAKDWLLDWPNTTKIWSPGGSRVAWIRAQPPMAEGRLRAPRLVSPGSKAFDTQPDGLWFTLGIARGDEATEAAYADCVAIEVCASSQNLSDKRSRYAARTASLVLDLREAWLDREVPVPGRGGPKRTRRVLLAGQLPATGQVLMPVRHLRVLYALPDGSDSLYARAKDNLVMEAHEWACPVRMLGQFTGPGMQDFVKRLGPFRHYMT